MNRVLALFYCCERAGCGEQANDLQPRDGVFAQRVPASLLLYADLLGFKLLDEFRTVISFCTLV